MTCCARSTTRVDFVPPQRLCCLRCLEVQSDSCISMQVVNKLNVTLWAVNGDYACMIEALCEPLSRESFQSPNRGTMLDAFSGFDLSSLGREINFGSLEALWNWVKRAAQIRTGKSGHLWMGLRIDPGGRERTGVNKAVSKADVTK